ncbi:hypothetical protein CBS101457_003489 [Exobasidium rhododendri]|nr:hypothetical protein CBS101457_003489 [Exobasidium rhododendri]
MTPSPPLDALIIGAGWSGLTSALQLSKAGKRVLCLEARQRIGGRAFSHSWNEDTPMENNERILPANEKGFVVDFGCSYIHGYEEGNPVREIAKRYGVNVLVSKPTATQIIGEKGALPKAISDKLHANLGAAQTAAKVLAKANRSKEGGGEVQSKRSLSSFLFDEKDSPLFKNLSEEERGQAKSLSRLLHIPLGTEMENIALDYYGSEEAFTGTDGIPEGGFSGIMASLEKEIKQNGGEIKMGQVVKKIINLGKGKGIRVEISSSSSSSSEPSEVIEAKTAVVTLPLAVLQQAKHNDLFQPSLTTDKREAIAHTTVGNLNKVLLTYQEPWWSLDVGTFFVLPSSSPSSSSSAPSLESIFSSNTLIVNSLCTNGTGLPPSVTSPSLLVMIGATPAKQLEKFSRLEVAEALDKYLSPKLQTGSSSSSKQTPVLKHSFYSRWGKQEFTGGATSTPVTLHNTPSNFQTLAKSEWDGSLYFAGEHCEVNHRGSIAGSVLSAQNASEEVLQYLTSSQNAKH